MRISASEIATYRNNLNLVAESAKDYMTQYVEALMLSLPNASVKDIRIAAIEAF